MERIYDGENIEINLMLRIFAGFFLCLLFTPDIARSSTAPDVIVCNGYKDNQVNGYGVGKERDSRVHHLRLYKEMNWCVFDDNAITCEHGNRKDVLEKIEGASYTKIVINRISGQIEEQTISIWRNNFMNLRFEGVCAEGKKKF